MAIEKRAQEPSLAPTVHAVAKPAAKALSWAMVAAGAAGLALAAVRTVVSGD